MKILSSTLRNMFFLKLPLIVGLALLDGLVCGRTLRAATSIRTASSVSGKKQTIPRNCREQSKFLDENLLLHPQPSSWTYIVVCDDAAWKATVAYLSINAPLGAVALETAIDIKHRTSYFRASPYLEPASLLRLLNRSLLIQ
jgi:hypothetical protein